MPKHIGIVACTAKGAALCYRTICDGIPLIIDPDDCPLPSLDSTRLLPRAALKEAIQ